MSSETCPTCGAPVRVTSTDEGTSHYEHLSFPVPPEWVDLARQMDDAVTLLVLERVAAKLSWRILLAAKPEPTALSPDVTPPEPPATEGTAPESNTPDPARSPSKPSQDASDMRAISDRQRLS